MSQMQTSLIAAIKAKRAIIKATFKGNLLNCQVAIEKTNGKKQIQKFSFVFDDAEACMGARLIQSSVKGTYAHHYAKDVFDAYLAWDEVNKTACV